MNGPTHVSGHTLDLVIARKDSVILQNVEISDLISDHMSVVFDINLATGASKSEKRQYRSLKDIDRDGLCEDIKCSDLIKTPLVDLDSLVQQFNVTLQAILDKHASKKTRAVKKRKKPWYNSEIHEQRRLRRKLTRKWHKTGLDTDRDMMIAQRDRVKSTIHAAKTSFYQHALSKAGTDSKRYISDNPGSTQ